MFILFLYPYCLILTPVIYWVNLLIQCPMLVVIFCMFSDFAKKYCSWRSCGLGWSQEHRRGPPWRYQGSMQWAQADCPWAAWRLWPSSPPLDSPAFIYSRNSRKDLSRNLSTVATMCPEAIQSSVLFRYFAGGGIHRRNYFHQPCCDHVLACVILLGLWVYYLPEGNSSPKWFSSASINLSGSRPSNVIPQISAFINLKNIAFHQIL